MPGAPEAVRAVVGAGIPVAVASNAGRAELRAKLARLGLAELFAGRVFSFEDVPRPKPAPDIYLAAARSCGAAPAECVVVEDSLLGVRAGIAAGCRVLGLTQRDRRLRAGRRRGRALRGHGGAAAAAGPDAGG